MNERERARRTTCKHSLSRNISSNYETPHKLISYAKKDVRTRKISSFLLEKFFKRIFLDRRYTLKHRSILMNTNYRRKSITYISLFRTRLSQTLKVAMRDKFFSTIFQFVRFLED